MFHHACNAMYVWYLVTSYISLDIKAPALGVIAVIKIASYIKVHEHLNDYVSK